MCGEIPRLQRRPCVRSEMERRDIRNLINGPPSREPREITLSSRLQALVGRNTAAAVAVVVVLVAVWVGGAWFAVIVGIAAAVAAIELGRMTAAWGQRPFTPVAAVMPAAIAVSYHLIPGPGYPENMELMAAFPALLALLTAAALQIAHRLRGLGARVLVTCCIAALIGGTLFHAPILRSFGLPSTDKGRGLIIFALAITLVSGGVAHLVNGKFDATNLVPGMRPNRSWKGAAAGILGAVLLGVLLIPLPGGCAHPAVVATISAALGVAAQLADRFHERLETRAGVDDSTRMFPGRRVLGWMTPLMWTVVVMYHFVAGFSGSME